jgi:hypothetical protein
MEMKKKQGVFTISLVIILVVLTVSCTPSESMVQTAIAQTQVVSTFTPISTSTPTETPTPEPMPTIIPTNTASIKNITSFNSKITISNFCEFQLQDIKFGRRIFPPNTSGYYSYYEVKSSDSTYLDIVSSVKNLDTIIKAAENFASISIIYDNKYNYDSFPVLVDGNGDFTMAFYGIEPLLSGVIHYLIEVPNQVETSSKSLVIVIKVSDQEYHYRYR